MSLKNVFSVLLLCFTLAFIQKAKADNEIYTIKGSTLMVHEGVTEIKKGDIPYALSWKVKKLQLPSTLKTIGDSAFYNSEYKIVNIPKGVTSIGASAFGWCDLEYVTIPNSVVSIGDNAFAGCHKLKSINILSSVRYMGEDVFLYNQNINKVIYYDNGRRCYGWVGLGDSCPQKITIPEGVISIDDGAFYNLHIQEVKLPNSLVSIGTEAFKGNYGLTTVNIPLSVSKIEKNVFEGCSEIQPARIVYYDNGRRCYGWLGKTDYVPNEVVIPEGVVAIDAAAFNECHIQKVVLPNGIISIGDNAFNYDLKSINIPSSIQFLGSEALPYCMPFHKMLYYANGTKCYGWVGDKDSCPSKIVFPKNVIYVNPNAFYGVKVEEVVFPEGMRIISPGIFRNCSRLKSVVLPQKIDSIGAYAFSSCRYLEHANIPTSNCVIGQGAFKRCTLLQQLLLSENGTVCLGWTSYNCPDTIRIPDGVKVISHRAFAKEILEYDVCQVRVVILPEGLDSIGYAAFSGSRITKLDIPNSVRYIGENAFSQCYFFEKVRLPRELISIPQYAFSDCRNLKHVDIPNSVISIENCAFENCTDLKNVVISNSVKSIQYGAFRKSGIRELVIPNSVTYIGPAAFQGCEELVSVLVSDSVEEIHYNTFYNCKSLKTVNLPKGLKSIDKYAFGECPQLQRIDVPDGADVHRDAFGTSLFTHLQKYGSLYFWIVFCLSAIVLLARFLHKKLKVSYGMMIAVVSIVVFVLFALFIILCFFMFKNHNYHG